VRLPPLAIDLLAAAVLAGIVLLITSGLAIAALVGIVVAVVVAISGALEARAVRRRRRRPSR
jgi:hypothetical protein